MVNVSRYSKDSEWETESGVSVSQPIADEQHLPSRQQSWKQSWKQSWMTYQSKLISDPAARRRSSSAPLSQPQPDACNTEFTCDSASALSEGSENTPKALASTAPSLIDSAVLKENVRRPSIFLLSPPTYLIARQGDRYFTMDNIDIPDLAARLGSDEDAVRKMAAFKLQSNVGDPSFAEAFIATKGLANLRYLVMEASGNTLAYSLTSLARLLEVEVDGVWEAVDEPVIQRVVQLVVCHPLVNILRGAMAILVSVVSRPYYGNNAGDDIGGSRALKPAIAVYPQFLEMLVSRLSSADHALCANALQLINSLMRDAVTHDAESEWPKFIQRLQDLGVIKAVYVLMRSSALQDLAHPLLEFQALTKVLLKKWKDVPVDLQRTEHRRTIKGIHLASNPEKAPGDTRQNGEAKPKHNPFKWRRLGFSTESPERDFEEMGFLGMMDLSDYIRKHEDEFQHILLEQATQPNEKRCPVAKASLIVTAVLYEHFEVDKIDSEGSKSYLALESRTNFDKVFKPLLLHWSRLHVAGLHAFWRLWKSTGAENPDDFIKIVELVRILFESVVGGADRTKGIEEVEKELADFDYERLRELQMELLELTYEDVWGPMLTGVREELHNEAMQFVKEQRIRCLLQGSWFPSGTGYKPIENGGPVGSSDLNQEAPSNYRFVKLSHNRRYLHYAEFDERSSREPELDELPDKIDLSIVSSVVSNVSATDRNSQASEDTLKELSQERMTTTKITIHGYLPSDKETGASRNLSSRMTSHSRNPSKTSSRTQKESVLLILHPQSHTAASEWLDGLLMLLNQQPITAETNKLINMVSSYGLKIRLLNVRFNEDEMASEVPAMPSREGLDENYYYKM